MGLDLYVGPLTRYYAGDWKTAVQQAAEASGVEYRVVRAPAATDAEPASLATAQQAVLAWRAAFAAAAGLVPLTWDESPGTAYFTDKPDWDGYWAVWYLAAHDEFPDVAAPSEIPLPSRLPDPRTAPLVRHVEAMYIGRRKDGGRQGGLFGRREAPPEPYSPRYPHLLLRPELWLPADFARPFIADDVGGRRVTIGSVPRLLAELEQVNDRTLRGDAADLQQWRADGPPEGDTSLERVGRFGMSVFLAVARYGEDKRLPIKLDY